MANSPVIELSHITRRFGEGNAAVTVLNDISLRVNAGEMLAIIGASGSGKSTLMNILGCLDKPSEGEMRIMDVPAHVATSEQLAQLRSQYLGFIFQRYHLMPYLTAIENVTIPALYTDMPASARHARAEHLLNRLGLGHRLNYRPAQLSGGQQQRVSIARALMNGAPVILAVEPTGALDSTSGHELTAILHGLHQFSLTLFTVSSDLSIAAQCHLIVYFHYG